MRELFKKIPNVNNLIHNISEKIMIDNDYLLKESINEELTSLRQTILQQEITDFDTEQLEQKIIDLYQQKNKHKHQKCINATGVIIHTNLGRSCLSAKQLENIDVLTSYNNLEFDLETTKRGSRYDLVEDVISKVCLSESALVVNNNAAAVMLVFNEFGKNKEVIVSNSELVEIGGSFRIPEIMKLSQANLKSVGTTNKTKLSDYIQALNENTGLVVKVHQSNFYMEGFTANVSAKELVDYRKENNLDYIIYEDLASGSLYDLSKLGLDKEPTVQDSVLDGVDIISFSGDKLLGSIQAGIIIGKKEYISRLKKNQLLRVLRPSGMILNIIESTFRIYLNEQNALENIPVLKYLSEDLSLVKERAKYLEDKLKDKFNVEVIATKAAVGGGCMPRSKIDSFGVSINELNVEKLKNYLMNLTIPIITIINEEKLIIDCKLLNYEEMDYVVKNIKFY